MFDLKRQEIAIDIDSFELQSIVNRTAQTIVNQTFSRGFPLLGTIDITVQNLETPVLEIFENVVKLTQRITIQLVSSSSLIPEVHGKIEIDSDFQIEKTDQLNINYKISRAIWLDGPTTVKGRSLGLVGKLTSVLINNTDIIESMVEERISEAFSIHSLRSMLLKAPHQFSLLGLELNIAKLHIQGWGMHVKEPYLRIQAIVDTLLKTNVPNSTDVVIEEKGFSISKSTTIFVSTDFFTTVLSAQIDKVNSLLKALPLHLKDIKLEIGEGKFALWLLPSQLNKPIKLSLSMHYEKRTRHVHLDQCELDSSRKSGLLVKGAIRLFGGKLEEMITSQFPLPIDPLLERAKTSLSQLKLPYKVLLDDPELIDFQIVKNAVLISLKNRITLISERELL